MTVRTALGDLLRRWDIDAVVVEEPDAALALIRDGQSFGLVISDYRLRAGQSGLDLLTQIAGVHPAPCPSLLLITGDADPGIAQGSA